MPADTFLQLGDFTFAKTEIPEKIRFGGDQSLVVHELVGGVRVVDSMGRQDAPLEWSGLLMGSAALQRAQYLDGLRIAGKVLRLQWSEFDYDVVIKSFHADFERWYQMPYSISCVVVKDNSLPVSNIADPGIDYCVTDDIGNVLGLATAINDGPLSSLVGVLDSAIKGVSSFAKATQSTINSVLVPLAAVQSRVSILVASTGNTIANVTTLGGILPNNPISTQASKLLGQAAAMSQLPQLYNLQSVLGRLGGNLGSIGSSGKRTTTSGGNLFSMASKEYGDASAWTTIAKANNLTDPQLSGINTLTIPKTSDSSGGLLDA